MSKDKRDRQLDRLEDAIQEAHRKVISGRVRDEENRLAGRRPPLHFGGSGESPYGGGVVEANVP